MKLKEDKFLLLTQKTSFLQNFCLLLLYSLVSGIYKIVDNQILMLLNVPIVLFLLRSNCATTTNNISLFYKYDLFFLLYIFYLLFLEVVVLFNVKTNVYGLLIGLFLDFFPVIGFIYSRKIKFESFVQILLIIAFVHLFIGILLYPPFSIYLTLGPIAEIFVDQMLFGRMSSVSGSLAFGNLMMYGCIISFFYNKKLLPFLLFGLIFSSQRSSWGGFLLCILLYVYQNIRTGKYKSILFLLIALLLVGLCVCVVFLIFDIDLSFIEYRFSRLTEAGDERSIQWLHGLENFVNNPIGTGFGQVGHVAVRYTKDDAYYWVADGDYFRIISEHGIGGGLFYLVFLFFFFLIFCSKLKSKKECTIISLIGASFIQMIGSNIHEFYFNNFILWILVGYFFVLVNSKFRLI